MKARVVASDPDEPTTTIQASHYPEEIQFSCPEVWMEVITSRILFLATRAVMGSPRTEAKLPVRLMTISDNHGGIGEGGIPKNHILYS